MKGTPPGYGRLVTVCARLAELAEAKIGNVTHGAGSATSAQCNAETGDETAPLNVFSNPLYTYATPKHVC